MAEKQSEGRKARRLLRRAGDVVTSATGTLTGKDVEEKVAEYSEVYTQVLLGLHGDLALQSRKVDDHDKDIDALRHQIADAAPQSKRAPTSDKEIEAMRRQISSMGAIRRMAIAAFAIALLALGISVWTAL